MSLLLDALKKAAQEKQNTSSASAGAETEAELTIELAADSTQADDINWSDAIEKPVELELHDVLALSDPIEVVKRAEIETVSEAETKDHRITPTPSTVTDEALQFLIHKTNDAHKKSRIMSWGGIVTASLLLLSIGGLYFYFEMVVEIETMQRKHQIALATLKSQTKIEENLTSLAVVPESANQAKKVKVPENRTTRAESAQAKKISESSTTRAARQAFSVHRAEKRDPVSEALQRGWAAYHNRNYELASLEYKTALSEEPKNHDALLGLAAVAIQLDNMDTARDMYIQLLELDPRDSHAHAGLAIIAQKSGGELSEAKLKQLIEYRPDDAHLQFALGNLYVQEKSWPQAQIAFFNAWKADSQNADYAYNLAVSLDHLGKHKAAKTYYQDSLKFAAGKNVSFSADAVKSRLAYLGASR